MNSPSDEMPHGDGTKNAENGRDAEIVSMTETGKRTLAIAAKTTVATVAEVLKPESITWQLCRTAALTSAVLGAAVRIAKKRDPEFFNLHKLKNGDTSAALTSDKTQKPPPKPLPRLKRLWNATKSLIKKPFKMLGGLVLGWLCYRDLKKSGFAVSFAVAERIAAFWGDEKDKKAGRRPTLYRRIKYWCFLNLGLEMADMYLKENDLSLADAKRTYDLCRRFIKAIISEGYPEKTFAQLLDFATARRRDVKWGYFDKCQGGLFSPQVQEVVIVILQFGPECSKTLFGSLRQLTEKVDPDVKQVAREIRDEFLESTGLKSIADVANRAVLRLLGDYCTKMRKDAKQLRDRERMEKWSHAQQALAYLSSHTPTPSNDATIEKLVHEFARRANLAGAATYATREIDAEDETYEVSVTMAARILGVNRKTIERWEEPDGKHLCPVPGYSKKLRRKEAAFMKWKPNYTVWKDMNKKERKGHH